MVNLGLRRDREARYYELDAPLETELLTLAEQEQRPAAELVTQLVAEALARRRARTALFQQWESLTTREQQVAALTCLGYTNPQIAAKLFISVHTVDSHQKAIAAKFELHGKDELRYALRDWDFSKWDN